MLCITKRQLANLVDIGLPKHGNGRESYYVWPEAFQWYLAYKVDLVRPKQEQAPPDDEKESYSEAVRRKTIAEADLAELKLAHERGEVVAVPDVEKNISQVAGNIRAKLLGMSSKLSPRLEGEKSKPKIKQIIEAEVTAILDELSNVKEPE